MQRRRSARDPAGSPRDGCSSACRSPPGHRASRPADGAAPSGAHRRRPPRRTGRVAAREVDARRGVPGPSGAHHRHRPARRPSSTRDGAPWSEAAGRSMPRTSFASSSTCRRRACSSPSCDGEIVGAARPRPAAVRRRRRRTSARSTCSRSDPDARRGSRDGRAPRGAPALGRQQGLPPRRGAAAGGSRAMRARWGRHGFGDAGPAHLSGPSRPRGIQRARQRIRAGAGRSRRHRAAHIKESSWARTSPSSWTWRTSSTRPRRPGVDIDYVDAAEVGHAPAATSSARTPTPGSTRTTRTSATSTRSWRATATRS